MQTVFVVALEKFIHHPYFDNLTLENDISVLRLQHKLTFSPNIRAITVNSYEVSKSFNKAIRIVVLASHSDAPMVPDGKIVLISGWGFTKEVDRSSVAEKL